MSSIDKRPQLNRDYAKLKHDAKVLYIKEGLSLEVISQRLSVSMPTLGKWAKVDSWNDLRPDFTILAEYKAAHLYVVKGHTTGEIAQKLSISEITIRYWVDTNGWNTARLVANSPIIITEILDAFCGHLKPLMPKHTTEIDFIKQDYLNKL